MTSRPRARSPKAERTTPPVLDDRKSSILRKVVAEHIETGQPVGSVHVVRDPEIDVSPATVRSDMAALEREGYLTHPHTSAGRIPTDRGYRFFVDHLERSELDAASAEQVQEFFGHAHGELERMLRDTSQLLSHLTDHASVVVAPAHTRLSIRSLLVTGLSPNLALLVVVLSNGIVEKHLIELGAPTGEDALERTQQVLREHLVGQTLGRLSDLARTGDAELDALCGACLLALASHSQPLAEGDEVYVGGTARMAEQFAALEQVREVLSILEQSFVVVSLIRDVLSNGERVSIGAEHQLGPLAECSLVVAPYEVDNEVVGTIGVLGPTRMNYSQALAAVAVVSGRLSRQLSSG